MLWMGSFSRNIGQLTSLPVSITVFPHVGNGMLSSDARFRLRIDCFHMRIGSGYRVGRFCEHVKSDCFCQVAGWQLT